jgi:hypothetical protein
MDLTSATWRTSSYSGGNGGQCIQVDAITNSPDGLGGLCAIRDSKDPLGATLTFSAQQWRKFTDELKAGRRGLA